MYIGTVGTHRYNLLKDKVLYVENEIEEFLVVELWYTGYKKNK